MNKVYQFIIVVSFFVLDGCIDPFSIHLNNSQEAIIVEGMITDQPGPYLVKIYKASALDDQISEINWIKGSSVWMYDDQGSEEKLTEVSDGNYKTSVSGISGVIGRTYHIKIQTDEGNIYESVPEKLLPVGDIDSLYFSFEQNEDPTNTDYLTTKNGFNVYVDSQVTPEQQGLVRWRWNGTFEITTTPERQTKTVGSAGGGVTTIPDPPSCSGWIYTKRDGLKQVSECKCCDCWVEQYNDYPLLSDKRFINNNKIKSYKVAFITANRRFFFKKYHLEVEQMSTSQNVYDFWTRVQLQKQNGSDLFQTPAPQTSGNIKAVSTSATQALGYFAASSVKKKSVFIARDAIPYSMPEMDTINESCTQVYQHSSTEQPLFW